MDSARKEEACAWDSPGDHGGGLLLAKHQH